MLSIQSDEAEAACRDGSAPQPLRPLTAESVPARLHYQRLAVFHARAAPSRAPSFMVLLFPYAIM